MLAALIRFSLTQRLLLLVLTVMLVGAGVQAFLGLPIDVRHVTLSSGMLAFAGAGLRGWFTTGWFFWALAGVATMFVLNLSVSFFLSLYTASRAYDLERRELAVLGARLLRRFAQRPMDFVLPRRMDGDAGEKA